MEYSSLTLFNHKSKYFHFISATWLALTSCKSPTMEEHIEPFYVIGITTQSTNENKKSVEDMGKLWERFFSENVSNKIPKKQSDAIYSVFLDYESDYKGKYTALIGHRVESLENVPEKMIGRRIGGGTYKKIVSKGKMPEAVIKSWQEIWENNSELKRAYKSDFEVYTEKSNNGDASEVIIYLSVQP